VPAAGVKPTARLGLFGKDLQGCDSVSCGLWSLDFEIFTHDCTSQLSNFNSRIAQNRHDWLTVTRIWDNVLKNAFQCLHYNRGDDRELSLVRWNIVIAQEIFAGIILSEVMVS